MGCTGPIPWDKIYLYAQYLGLNEINQEPFIQTIREMDSGFLEWKAKEAERTAETTSSRTTVQRKSKK